MTRFLLPAYALLGFIAFLDSVPVSWADKGGKDYEAVLRANARAEEAWRRRRQAEETARARFLDSLRVSADGSECMAFDPTAGACVVNVAAFNGAVAGWTGFQAEGSPASAQDAEAVRRDMLRILLEEAYVREGPLSRQARDSLDAAYAESLRARVRAAREWIGDSLLRATYRRNFDALFRGRTLAQVRILAASDSVWLDSARRATPETAWRLIPAEALPSPFQEAALTLDSGRTSGPSRLPFGFICMRSGGWLTLPDTSFEEALPRLIALCAGPQEPAASIPAMAIALGKSAPPADPMRLRLWLRPRPAGRPWPRRDPIEADTAGLAAMWLEGRALAPELRKALAAFAPLQPGDVVGPSPTIFGIAYFNVLAAPKDGLLPTSAAEASFAPGTLKQADALARLRNSRQKDEALRASQMKDYRSRSEIAEARKTWIRALQFRYITWQDKDISPASEKM
jgi:hypothetical protein